MSDRVIRLKTMADAAKVCEVMAKTTQEFRGLPVARILLRHAAFIALVVLSTIPSWADELGNAVRTAVGKTDASVVRLRVIGGESSVDGDKVNSLVTTAVVISEAGEILTSQFALQGNPEAILAEDKSGNRANVKVVATDHVRRLVLLKAVKGQWTPAMPAVTDKVAIGQWSIALGRFYQSDSSSVSVGIISALSRIHGMAIQTDAKISPINYGGPLINLDGQVLGILVPLSPRGQGNASAGIEWYDSGIGFAIPMQEALMIADRLRSGKDLKPGRLGVKLATAGIFSSDIRVERTASKGPADLAGLKKNDQLVSVNGRVIERISILEEAVASRYAGDSLALQIKRGSESLTATVELVEELPTQVPAYLGFMSVRSAKARTSKGIPGAEAIAKLLEGGLPGQAPAKPAPAPKEQAGEESDHVPLVVVNNSPASNANLPERVEVLKLNDQKTTSLAELRVLLADLSSGSNAKIEYRLPGSVETKTADLVTEAKPEGVTQLSSEVLAAIKAAGESDMKSNEKTQPEDTVAGEVAPSEKALPEGNPDAADGVQRKELPFEERGKAIVFSSTKPSSVLHGIVILISAHDVPEEQVLVKWKPFLNSQNLVVAVPVNPEKSALTADDIPLVMSTIQGIGAKSNADLRRIVVVGEGEQSRLAWQLTFGGPSPVSGIALTSGWISTAESEGAEGSGHSILLMQSPKDAQSKALFSESRESLQKAGFWVSQPTDDTSERSIADWSLLLRAF